MSGDQIVATLVPVRGIGRWTVEMMLMFPLGCPDVLQLDDLDIRKGAQPADRRAEMQAQEALVDRGARWGLVPTVPMQAGTCRRSLVRQAK